MKKIEILGTGCHKCDRLAEMARRAADELGIEYEFVKITDIKDIIERGVVMTPGLVVDGVVKSAGKVPSIEEIKNLLK